MNRHFWRGFWQGMNPLFWLMCALWGVDRLMWFCLRKWGCWRWWSVAAYRIQVWSIYRSVELQYRFGFTGPWGKP